MLRRLFPSLLAVVVTFWVAACDGARPAERDPSVDDMALIDAVVDVDRVDASGDTGLVDDGGAADALDPPGPHAVPARGPMSGYYPVTFPVADLDPAAIVAVTVAGVAAYGVEATADGVRAVVQGAPTPGPATVEVTTVDGVTHDLGALFTYEPPLDPRFTRIVAFGGGLGQGLQRGVPSPRGALLSPPAQLARRLGGFMPLPVPIDDLFIPMSLADFGPPPACDSPTVTAFVVDQSPALIRRLSDENGRGFSMHRARVDPDITPANVASGNARARDILDGPGPRNIAARFLSHLVHDPYGDPFGEVARPQIAEVEAFAPTLVVSFDFFGNDLISSVADVRLNPEANTPAAELHPAIEAVVDRLAALDADVFLADLPRPSVLSRVALLRAQAEAEGALETLEADLAAVDAATEAANAVLRAAADRHPRVHVVPLAAAVEALAAEGRVIGAETIDVRRFGGLIGLDGVHFTDTGYAVVADLFVEHIGAALGVELPAIDVEAVFAADPERPSALAAEGFDRDACQR